MSEPTFSQRYGYSEVRTLAQRGSIDQPLRVGLWNAVDVFYLSDLRGQWLTYTPGEKPMALRIWTGYFKQTLDTLPTHWDRIIESVRGHFMGGEWFEVYDFIEFLARQDGDQSHSNKFQKACNTVLERELSAYRLVAGRVTEMTSATDVAAVEDALKASRGLGGAETHLRTALTLLSDRTAPDYRNSIKESISAVEAVANAIAGKPATLGQALNTLEKKIEIHPALKGAFGKLYGYTSDAEGIRHALMDEPNLTQDDAKFMLVACSAFVSYLTAQAARAGG